MVEAALRKWLGGAYNPIEGMPIEDITKSIYPNWRGMDGPIFRREAKYIERALGNLRHEAFDDYIAEKLRIYKESDTPEFDITQIPPPEFLPFALPIKEFYWNYFNCVKKPWTENVEKICRQKADGLIRTADLLDEMF